MKRGRFTIDRMVVSARTGLAAISLLLLSGAAHAALPSSWSITDLDGLPGQAGAISDSGIVAGCSDIAGSTRAFTWSNGTSRELSPELPAGSKSCAYAVNNSGMAAGIVDGQIAVWSAEGLTRLGVSGMVTGINEAGTIVGYVTPSAEVTTPTRAFMWRQGVLTDLHPPGAASSKAVSINEAGQVAGMADSDAVIWENATVRVLRSGAEFINVGAMNDRGEVVGLYLLPGDNKSQPYIFNGAFSPLPGGARGDLSALTITNRGWALVNGLEGYATIAGDGERLSFEFMPSMRAAGWKRLEPRAMNERGWIIGYGNHDGVGRKFLIVPVDAATNANPTARASQRNGPLIRSRSR